MEHRSGERKAASLDAVITCSRFGLLRGRILDLGLEGLYISVETNIVPIGAEVTVTFQPDPQICNECLSLKGRVSHQSLHGFGVEFAELDPKCRDVLPRLLPRMPPVPRKAVPVFRAC